MGSDPREIEGSVASPLERGEKLFPWGGERRLGGRVTVCMNDHRGPCHLLGVVRLYHVHDVEVSRGRPAVLPAHARALCFDPLGDRRGELLDVLEVAKGLGGEAAEDEIGAHMTLRRNAVMQPTGYTSTQERPSR